MSCLQLSTPGGILLGSLDTESLELCIQGCHPQSEQTAAFFLDAAYCAHGKNVLRLQDAPLQAALEGIVPAENITVLEVITTGGSDNHPYETDLSEPDKITPTTQARNAPTETLIRFYYPSSLRAQLQSAIDRHDPALYSGGITTISLTEAVCSASPSGTCAPGRRLSTLLGSMLLHKMRLDVMYTIILWGCHTCMSLHIYWCLLV